MVCRSFAVSIRTGATLHIGMVATGPVFFLLSRAQILVLKRRQSRDRLA